MKSTAIAPLFFVLASTAVNAATVAFDVTVYEPRADPMTPRVVQYTGTGTLSFDEKMLGSALSDVNFYNSAYRTIYQTSASYTISYGPHTDTFSAPIAFAEIYTTNPTPGLNSATLWDYDVREHYVLTGPLDPGPRQIVSFSWNDYPTDRRLSAEHVEQIYLTLAHATGGASFSNLRVIANPVPESGEWAMMLGGLAVVGGFARRRKS